MTRLHRRLAALAALLLLFPLLPVLAQDDEEEISYREAPPRMIITVSAPRRGQTFEAGSVLPVKATCPSAAAMTAVLRFDDGAEKTLQANGGVIDDAFSPEEGEYFTAGATLTLTAAAESGETAAETIRIISPRDQLIADMFDEALRNSKSKEYRFAPAQEDWHVGVCKNFVMRLFDTFSPAYRMAAYPTLTLYMPKNKSKADSAPYDYGIEWRAEGPSDGAPFEIAAQFKYDSALSKAENMEKCREVLHSVRRGDFFQMVGYYYYGNGPHSLLFMTDYDPATDEVHWTDSNMKGERVNGVRWGYIQYDAVKKAEWFVEAICTKNRGCTIYRLRDDLYVK